MIRLATPLAFDGKGVALHKGDVCNFALDRGEDLTPDMILVQVEIEDILPNNKAIVVKGNGELMSVETGLLERVVRSEEPAPDFSGEGISVEKLNEKKKFQRIRMLSSEDIPMLDGVADALLKLMKSVNKSVQPLQFKVNKLVHEKVAADGVVEVGRVECQVQVKDNYSQRRGTADIVLAVKDSEVESPTVFTSGDKQEFPFTDAGFKRWLDIPSKQYISKKPSPAVRSNRDSY